MVVRLELASVQGKCGHRPGWGASGGLTGNSPVQGDISMASQHGKRAWNRREVLATGCTVAGALGLGPMAYSGEYVARDQDGDFSPFKMGLQSYSLRGLTKNGKADRAKALAASKALGIHYWESYPAHVPMNIGLEAHQSLKQEIEGAGVTVIGYGVVPFGNDADSNRRTFEFAKNLGISYLSADPDPACFDDLDKLVEKFDIAVGIHNHGPGHRYAQIETIAKAIKDHHPKIGCCVDAGHFLRSKIDPVDAVEAFGTRVYGVHLKDVKDAKTFTVLGQGDLRTVDLLKALARNKYGYCLAIEYEEKPENPIDDIKACLVEAARAIAEVRKA
jgi:inosose dehydratase